MTEEPTTNAFSLYLSEHVRRERENLTRQWVDELDGQLRVDAKDVLPTESLLNHIPDVLERVADFVGDPGKGLLEAMVVEDLGRLADLRRRQGFGLHELLREYHILSDIIQRSIEHAAAEFDGSANPLEVVIAVGRLKDAIHLLSAVTARSFRLWNARYDRESRDQLDAYGHIVAHELGNRLGAAETAILLLQSDYPVPEDRRARLYDLIRDSIREGLRTIHDVGVLARPLTLGSPGQSIALSLILGESIRLAMAAAEEMNITVALEGPVPDARVPGPAVRVALSNLLGNAVKYHHESGDERWVRVSSRRTSAGVEIVVEDNGPGIPEDARERVFEYSFRGEVKEEGSGLGLAITQDALDRADGSIRVEPGEEGGARFVVLVPECPDDAGDGTKGP